MKPIHPSQWPTTVPLVPSPSWQWLIETRLWFSGRWSSLDRYNGWKSQLCHGHKPVKRTNHKEDRPANHHCLFDELKPLSVDRQLFHRTQPVLLVATWNTLCLMIIVWLASWPPWMDGGPQRWWYEWWSRPDGCAWVSRYLSLSLTRVYTKWLKRMIIARNRCFRATTQQQTKKYKMKKKSYKAMNSISFQWSPLSFPSLCLWWLWFWFWFSFFWRFFFSCRTIPPWWLLL